VNDKHAIHNSLSNSGGHEHNGKHVSCESGNTEMGRLSQNDSSSNGKRLSPHD
jgi:hypothetical protein